MKLRKRRAIESYWTELPSQLERDYGKSNDYPEWQISQATERCGLNTRYIDYAYVMFMSAESFGQRPRAMSGSREYVELHEELANHWFSGDMEFMQRHGFSGPDVGKVPHRPQILDSSDDFKPFAKAWRWPF